MPLEEQLAIRAYLLKKLLAQSEQPVLTTLLTTDKTELDTYLYLIYGPDVGQEKSIEIELAKIAESFFALREQSKHSTFSEDRYNSLFVQRMEQQLYPVIDTANQLDSLLAIDKVWNESPKVFKK